MDESEFVRQLEKHIDGLVEKSRSAFSISQEKYDQAVASWVSKNFEVPKIGARNVLYCCTGELEMALDWSFHCDTYIYFFIILVCINLIFYLMSDRENTASS